MFIEWTKHLKDPKDKADFEKEIVAYKRVLGRLKDILQEKEDALYDSPNWSERQSGNRETLRYLKKLVDLDQQRTP